MNKPCHKLHHYIPARPTRHRILLHTPTILHMKMIFGPACHLRQKISYKTNLSHSTLLHFRRRLIRFKHRFHRVGSFSSWLNQKQVKSNINLSQIIFLLVESKTSRFKHKFESDHVPFLIHSHN